MPGAQGQVKHWCGARGPSVPGLVGGCHARTPSVDPTAVPGHVAGRAQLTEPLASPSPVCHRHGVAGRDTIQMARVPAPGFCGSHIASPGPDTWRRRPEAQSCLHPVSHRVESPPARHLPPASCCPCPGLGFLSLEEEAGPGDSDPPAGEGRSGEALAMPAAICCSAACAMLTALQGSSG